MTRLTVLVNDDTLLQLQTAGDTVRRTLEETAGLLLRKTAGTVPLQGRLLVVTDPQLEALEQILGMGSLLNPQDLVKKVERLAGISFLHVRLPFSPNQLEALAEKAARNGLTVDQLVERTAPRIYEQFFDLVARV